MYGRFTIQNTPVLKVHGEIGYEPGDPGPVPLHAHSLGYERPQTLPETKSLFVHIGPPI
jgi:hypothetical protein